MSYELIESGRRRIIVQRSEPTPIKPAAMSRRKEIQMKGNIKKLAVGADDSRHSHVYGGGHGIGVVDEWIMG